MNLEMTNGHVVEMQLHLEGIIKVKNGPGHAPYEQSRSISARAQRAGRKLTSQEIEEIKAIDDKMRSLYDEAAALGEGGAK